MGVSLIYAIKVTSLTGDTKLIHKSPNSYEKNKNKTEALVITKLLNPISVGLCTVTSRFLKILLHTNG